MNLKERIIAMEAETLELRGRLAAMHCAVCALAGETDIGYRLGLFEDLSEITLAKWLGLSIADAQVDRAKQAFESGLAGLREGFLRPFYLEMFRNPLPRKTAPPTHFRNESGQ